MRTVRSCKCNYISEVRVPSGLHRGAVCGDARKEQRELGIGKLYMHGLQKRIRVVAFKVYPAKLESRPMP